jgi:hypothetical protein
MPNYLKIIKNPKDALFIFGFLAVVSIVFYYNSKNTNLKIAYKGYGPQSYVAQKHKPENFKKDFSPSLLTLYDNSVSMWVYPYLARYWGINPSITIHPYMFIQTFLFFLSVSFLTQALFQNRSVTFISMIIVALSNLAGLNLSRFGSGYGSLLSLPLFYGYANAFRFFAFGFFLRNKYIPCFIFLALSFYCHLNMGFFALVFVAAYMLYKPHLIRERSLIGGISIFVVLVAPHILSVISNTANASGDIPVDQWVKSTRIFSSHWYPLTMKLFTHNAHREFFPFLLLCFFFFVSLRYQDTKDEKNGKILIGSICCLVISCIGILASEPYPIPFLIRISLQRSTGLITFFGVLYLIYYLFKKAGTGNLFIVFLAGYSLLVFIFAKPGIAVLPLFLLLHSDMKEGYFGLIKISSNKIRTLTYLYYATAILILFVTITSIVKYDVRTGGLASIAQMISANLWSPLQYFSPFYGFDFLLRGGGFKITPILGYVAIGLTLFTLGVACLRAANKSALNTLFMGILFAISLSVLWYIERDRYFYWHNRYGKIASSYLDVQSWARKNTPVDSLFMPDPAHYYGWRDFSERSSFGNLREWGYSIIAYTSDRLAYEEGLKRMREFDIDIDMITEDDLKNRKLFIYGKDLSKKVREVFYRMKSADFMSLSRKYGLDYIVMNKKYHEGKFDDLKIAYENKHYIVYEM